MAVITSKKTILTFTEKCIDSFSKNGEDVFINEFHQKILRQKVKFPLLEYAAENILEQIAQKNHLSIAKKVISLHEIGSNVIAGIILQHYAQKNPAKAFDLAIEFILDGNEWYSCDIIAERVMGHTLLNHPSQAVPLLKKLSKHKEDLAARSVGVATHYAVKKGLLKKYVDQMFNILLSMLSEKGYHRNTGIGWGAKTCAKFHPDITNQYEKEIEKTPAWFRAKIKTGLSRNYKYASRYTN